MITFEDVKHGYEKGAVWFSRPFYSLDDDEVVCFIGYPGTIVQNWFFFGGEDAEDTTPTQFIDDVGLDNALEWVTNALNESIYEIDENEYAFYEAVLEECKEE